MTNIDYEASYDEGFQKGYHDAQMDADNAFRDGYGVGLEDGTVEGLRLALDYVQDIVDNVEVPCDARLNSYASLFRKLRELRGQ